MLKQLEQFHDHELPPMLFQNIGSEWYEGAGDGYEKFAIFTGPVSWNDRSLRFVLLSWSRLATGAGDRLYWSDLEKLCAKRFKVRPCPSGGQNF
jgi:hypothetical protein